jgi:hypothetical protein
MSIAFFFFLKKKQKKLFRFAEGHPLAQVSAKRTQGVWRLAPNKTIT